MYSKHRQPRPTSNRFFLHRRLQRSNFVLRPISRKSKLDVHAITNLKMKVKIKKWNAVATWRWDIPDDDVCGICQVHFDGTCPTCKYPGDDCSLLSGKCGHNFHMHCIVEWIKQDSSKGQCPMCRQKFEWTDNPAMGGPMRIP
ncbi:RING/U-box, partial [Hyaloscypha hepaticicola]